MECGDKKARNAGKNPREHRGLGEPGALIVRRWQVSPGGQFHAMKRPNRPKTRKLRLWLLDIGRR